ncbi:MAG TPA: hypothetical protein VM223_07525, partial [Planctomycetota bacterium]|nr:hypothetical protein [Planctomycetota bacterium]
MARRRKGLRRKVPRHPNIEKAGSVFYVRIRMGGERLTIPCGPHFRDAEVVLANKLAERRHARLRRAGMASDDFPLASLWERYVAHCEDVLPEATVRGYREAGARWQKYLAADLLVSGLSREHAKGLVSWARGRG